MPFIRCLGRIFSETQERDKMIVYQEGDLTDSYAKYIAHQCNCVSKGYSGLARTVFEKYPWANTYGSNKRKCGDIDIMGNGMDKRFVINMYSQYSPGKPSIHSSDPYRLRLIWFQECLNKIREMDNLESIAFPYNIGCGLAGGKWEDYKKMIEDFDMNCEFELRNVKIYIIKYTGK